MNQSLLLAESGSTARKLQQQDLTLIVSFATIFLVSLATMLSEVNRPGAQIAGFPAMSLVLSCCFIAYCGLTAAAYQKTFKNWRVSK